MQINHTGSDVEKLQTELKRDTIVETLMNATNQEINDHIDNSISNSVSNLTEANANFTELRRLLKIMIKLEIYVAKKVLGGV